MEVIFPDWIERLTGVLQKEALVRETALLEHLLIFWQLPHLRPITPVTGHTFEDMAAFWSDGDAGFATSLNVIAPGVSAAP